MAEQAIVDEFPRLFRDQSPRFAANPGAYAGYGGGAPPDTGSQPPVEEAI